MRVSSICILLVVFCLGCNRAEEARRNAAQKNLKQLGEQLQNYQETHDTEDAAMQVDVISPLAHSGICASASRRQTASVPGRTSSV